MKYLNNLNQEHTLDSSDNVYFIYGKNGVGKTIFSNSVSKEGYETVAFNVSFISKNVYVTTEEGESISTQNTENFTNFIVIEEESVVLKKRLETLQEAKREIEKFEFTRKYESDLGKSYNTDLIDYFKKLISNKNQTIISKEYFEDDISKLEKECNVKNGDDFERHLKKIKNNIVVQDFLTQLDQTGISLFLGNLEVYNERLKKYNKVIDDIKRINEYTPSKDHDTENWKKYGLQIHINLNECLFCNHALEADYYKLKDYYENSFVKAHEKIKVETKGYIDGINKVINTQVYNNSDVGLSGELNLLRGVVKSLESVYDTLFKVNEIESAQYLSPVVFSLKKDSIMQIREELIKYLTIKQMRSYVKFEINIYLNSIIQAYLKKEIDKKFEKFINDEMMLINEKIASLGLPEQITLVQNNQGGKKRIKIKINNKEISQVSEGEKHKLALGIFLAKLDRLDLNNKIIVFDDPVSTLDIQTYFMLRDNIKNLIRRKLVGTSSKLIILSHDMHYLYIQASDSRIVNDDNKFVFFKMYSGGKMVKQDLKYLKMDDLSCFSYVLKNVQTPQQFLLTAPLLFKMFRHHLDMVARLNGVDIYITELRDILTNLVELGIITECERKTIQKSSDKISNMKGKNQMSAGDLKELYDCYFEMVDVLEIPTKYDRDFHISFDDSYCINIDNLEKEDEVIYDVLIELWKIIFSDADSNERRYLSHPNNQITRNLLSFDF